MGAWISNSASSDFAMDIVILLFVIFTSNSFRQKRIPRCARDDKIAGTRRLSDERAQAGFISRRTRDGKPPSALLDGGFGAASFGAFAHAFVNVRPAGDDASLMVGLNQAKAGVTKFDDRDAIFFAEAVLDVVRHWIGH